MAVHQTLSSGFALHGATGGVESKLIAFIEDTAQPIDKNTWFSFDRLTFQTGAAELDMTQSQEQVTNIAEIMKAYPTAKLKIGGYTDNSGDAAANKTLSKQRADAVVAALVVSGVAKDRLEAEDTARSIRSVPPTTTRSARRRTRIDVNVRAR